MLRSVYPAQPVLLSNPRVPTGFGRPLAILSLVCLLAHIPLIASHFTMAPVITTVMAAVSLVCIPCIRRLWTSPTTHDCAVAAALATAMAGSHAILAMSMGAAPPVATVGSPTAHHHQSHAPTTMSMAHADMPPMPPALQALFVCATAIAVLQAVVGVTAIAITVGRHRSKLSRSRASEAVAPRQTGLAVSRPKCLHGS
jgi:hypothetical protein